MDSKKIVLKAGIWYTISDFVSKGMAFITIPFFSRYLSTAEFGEYNKYQSWLLILTVFISLSVSSTIIRAQYDYEDRMSSYVLSVCMLNIAAGAVFVFLSLLFRQLHSIVFGVGSNFLIVMAFTISCTSIFETFQAEKRFKFEYKSNVILSLIITILCALFSVAFAILFDDRLFGRVVGNLIPLFIIAVFILIHLKKNAGIFDYNVWKYAFPICIPYIPHQLSLVVLSSVDRIMITNICGAEYNAIYSMGYTCGQILFILAYAMNKAVSPWISDSINSRKTHELHKYLPYYLMVYLVIVTFPLLLMPEILLILGGQEYNESIQVIVPVAVGYIFQYMYMLFVIVEQYEKKTLMMAFASIVSAGVNYFLNLLFIPIYGYIAAAYTTAASYFLLMLLHMFIVRKIKMHGIFNAKKFSILLLTAIVELMLIGVLYRVNIIRYFVFVCYFLFVLSCFIKNKETILRFLRK